MAEVLGAVAATIDIVTGGVKGGSWVRRKLRERKERKSAAQSEPEYPVRLTCSDADDYHPSAGFHEGYYIEVFNHSEKPVTVKGFGLDLTMHHQAEWHRYEYPIGYSHSSFPSRVEPNDGLDGYIDTEALADQIYLDGEKDDWIETHAYVDLIGFGMKKIDPKDQSD